MTDPRRSQAIQAAEKEGGTEGTHVSVQLPEPTCPYCGSHEVRATQGVLSITGVIVQAQCACGEWYRLDDGP